VPLGRFSAATSFELGPISYLLAPIDFSAGFSEKSARVFSQLLCSCFADTQKTCCAANVSIALIWNGANVTHRAFEALQVGGEGGVPPPPSLPLLALPVLYALAAPPSPPASRWPAAPAASVYSLLPDACSVLPV
jgi:hypothetical protein